MRNKFDMQLETLNNELISMGALCEKAISSAIKALLENDKSFCEAAIATEKEIDQKEKDIESLCMKLLLQQQPVARDLRLISSALKMITDMERIGDQAQDIAEIVLKFDIDVSKNNEHIAEMARHAVQMVTLSVDAFVKRDLDLAKKVIKLDDTVDELFVVIREDLVELIAEDKTKGQTALDAYMIVKYLERIGDHAVNLAEWVIFSVKGAH